MAYIIPTEWSTTTTYSEGNQVTRVGVVYEALGTISANIDPRSSELWKVVAVREITDYISLIEGVRHYLNVPTQNAVYGSIPLYIQLTEESFKTRVRVPQQRKEIILTCDAQSRVEIPGDLLTVLNLRHNSNAFEGYGTQQRGVIEIKIGNYELYRRAVLSDNQGNIGSNDYGTFDSPIYWYDNQYFWIGPMYAEGTEFELKYEAVIPFLGQTVLRVNTLNEALNAANQTLAEWVAAGNSEVSFVQSMDIVERNYYTAAAPQMLLYGAMLKAAQALSRPAEEIAMIEKNFIEAQGELQDMINRFEEDQAHQLFLENEYSSNIR